QRVLQVTEVHEVVGEVVQDVVGTEVWDCLGAIPERVAVASGHSGLRGTGGYNTSRGASVTNSGRVVVGWEGRREKGASGIKPERAATAASRLPAMPTYHFAVVGRG